MRFRRSVHVEAPVEKAFGFVSDPRNFAHLSKDFIIKDVKTTPQGMGTYYTWVMKLAGLRVQGFDVYTEVIPNKRITDTSSRFGTWIYSFEPEGSGAKMTMEVQPRSFWRIPPITRAMGWAMARRYDRFMPAMTARMEG